MADKVANAARRTVGGFVRSDAAIAGIGEQDGRTVRIEFQKEFLIARNGDDALVTVPDLITILDAETGSPITTESLRDGFCVVVLGLPFDARLRTPMGLKRVGPGCFRYDLPYMLVEQRFGAPRGAPAP